MRKHFKNSIYLFLSLLLMLSIVSCKGDNFEKRLELSKTLDLYSYSFVFGDDVLKDIDLVSTYEAMGCTFTTEVEGGETIDLNTLLEPGKSTRIVATLSKEEKIIFNLTIINNTKDAKPYKYCSIISSGISGNTSIILPQGIYCDMSEEELVKELGEPHAINESELFYIYTYFQYPHKVDEKVSSSITGNGYYFTFSKETKVINSFTRNMGLKASEGLTEYSGLVDSSGQKATFTTKLEIPNSYDGYGYVNINRLQTVINVNNIPYIVGLNCDFNISLPSSISKPLDYSFLFEKACDPVDPIEFVPDYLHHDGTSGYSYGFRDKGNKYTCKLNFANSQAYISSDLSYIMPLNQGDEITEEAKQEFKNIIKTFSSNFQFEIVK